MECYFQRVIWDRFSEMFWALYLLESFCITFCTVTGELPPQLSTVIPLDWDSVWTTLKADGRGSHVAVMFDVIVLAEVSALTTGTQFRIWRQTFQLFDWGLTMETLTRQIDSVNICQHVIWPRWTLPQDTLQPLLKLQVLALARSYITPENLASWLPYVISQFHHDFWRLMDSKCHQFSLVFFFECFFPY